MNDHPARAENAPQAEGSRAPNRYAITLAALLASAQVPVADQVEEQPAAPPHDYASGFRGHHRGTTATARATPVATDPPTRCQSDDRRFVDLGDVRLNVASAGRVALSFCCMGSRILAVVAAPDPGARRRGSGDRP